MKTPSEEPITIKRPLWMDYRFSEGKHNDRRRDLHIEEIRRLRRLSRNINWEYQHKTNRYKKNRL